MPSSFSHSGISRSFFFRQKHTQQTVFHTSQFFTGSLSNVSSTYILLHVAACLDLVDRVTLGVPSLGTVWCTNAPIKSTPETLSSHVKQGQRRRRCRKQRSPEPLRRPLPPPTSKAAKEPRRGRRHAPVLTGLHAQGRRSAACSGGAPLSGPQ